MKYLPRKYRESQTGWFRKRSITWHISVAFRKVSERLQMLTFAHIFQRCTQDSCAVLVSGRYQTTQDYHARCEDSQL